MSEKCTYVEVECLLKNGREIFVSLELPRDTVAEDNGVVTYTRNAEKGVREEYIVPRSEVAYMRMRTDEGPHAPSPYRTLHKANVPQSHDVGQVYQGEVPAGAGQS